MSASRTMFITSAGGSASTAGASAQASVAARPRQMFFMRISSWKIGCMLADSYAPAFTLAIGLFRLAGGILVLVARMRRPAARVEQAENGLVLFADRVQGAEPPQEVRQMREALGIAAGARAGGRETRPAAHARHALGNQGNDT